MGLGDIVKQQQKSLTEPEKKLEEIVQLVGFVVGEEEFAVPILAIQEIIKPIEWTRVPFVPDYVLGVFNLRGNVLPLIDLRKKFNAPSNDIDENTRFIVMKIKGEDVAFVIDRLTSAIRIEKSNILPPPDTYSNEEDIIEGVGRLPDGRIITILKVDNLIKREEIVPNKD
ncbi:chemotaxis protein CheW [Caminibacter mediatlanticus]|uniref:Purine-binding chemotaxis protein chew n=1 Tax=Caminibacter mediatlanticus TB-2 TaxID=391592 RepID=A0AAI9AID7_9BACT|nr:chemotaxis protein CheW [Caminibacter mediatlanticus]EDM24090.1 purine-binding chemotaxis protein chew [Caminibacter mediatlanticus TB-2]